MNKSIFLLTGYEHFFGQTRKPWVSLDTDLLVANLNRKGYSVEEIPFHHVMNHRIEIRDAIVFYTFSQRDNLRNYIKDIIFNLSNNNNLVIPSYELLLCHENKGFQELYKHDLGISDLKYQYLSSKRELEFYQINYPVVFKMITGSNAKGVYLVHSRQELEKVIKKMEPVVKLFQRFDFVRRRYLRNKFFPEYPGYSMRLDYRLYKDYITQEICFILQEFVPDLYFDYRVIIMGDRYYVSKRLTNKGDFRASGAKHFTFDFPIPSKLLDYSQAIISKINNPTVALDIGEKNGEFHLFELMATGFGINAIVKAPLHYIKHEGKWIEERTFLNIETLIADAWHKHISERKV
jgi:glutathione synthase/RimK-type ligase-like ATP-grasp enzyme